MDWQQPKSPRQGKGKGRGKGKRKEQWKGQTTQNQQKGQTKDQGKDKGKGKGANSQGSTMIPPEPPWTPSLNNATNLAPLPPPTEPPPTTEEGVMLKELLTALKKSPTEQDPEVKAIVQRSTLKEGQGAAQTLYSAVDDLTMAREALDCARLARHNLHIRWRNFLADCGCTLAEAYNRFPERGEEFIRSNRSSTTSSPTGCAEVRGVKDGIGRPSDSRRCGSCCNERGIGQSRQECYGCGIAGKSHDNVSPVAIFAGLSRSHGHGRGQLQQASENGWRRGQGIICNKLGCARWIAICYCACNAAICRPTEAFCPARQAVTEEYTCLGHDQDPLILKWTHSACNEPWFVPEWDAIERANDLSWKFGFSSSKSFSTEKVKQPTCERGRNVHFSSDVELRFCGFSDPVSASIKTTEQFIKQWPQKPWSLHLPKTDPNEGGTSLEPLSSGAVSIRKNHSFPDSEQFRTTDAFHNVPSTWFPQDNTNGLDHEDPEDELQHFLHEEPESIQILFDAFLREGLIIGPSLTESVFLRSWHIDHIREHRCWHYRIIELNGHWRTWFADILSAWRDKNDQNEDTIFSIVYPNPPRSIAARRGVWDEILFDIIIAQGLEAPRRAGLISVLHRDDPNARVRYALAASLPEDLSGHQLVQSGEYLHECNTFICTIRHGMMTIPFTMAPVHMMQDGDSFTIASRTGVTSDGAASSSMPPNAAAKSDDDTMHEESSEEDPGDSDDPAPSSDPQDPSSMQGVHIFRLGHQQVFNRLRWDTADHILQDAARSVRVQPAQCVCFHYLQVCPDDHEMQQEAIILQHVTDIAPGSTEKLILIDIELHAASVSSISIPQAPRVLRQVHKVVPVLTRQQVLHIARVSTYCEWMANGCFVFFNRVLWSIQDQGPRRITHGLYVRIVIPPPPDLSWDLAHALRVFEETADLFEKPEAFRLATGILRRAYAQTEVEEPTNGPQEGIGTICQFKGADLGPYDIDVPITNPPRAYQRRLRPEHDGTMQWLLDLGQIFADQAQEEAFVDEPMLYVQTWFVNHLHHTSCRTPRPLRLERYSITWIDDFRQLWSDVLRRNEVFSLRVVRPNPPQPRSWNYACHVIVEQAVHDHRAACLLTALFEGDRTDAINQGAFSLPTIIRRQTLIDTMEIEPYCEGRICTATWGNVPIHLVEATEIASGYSIRIRVRSTQSQVPIEPGTQEHHFDDLVLMQVPNDEVHLMQRPCGTEQHGTQLPTHNDECNAFALDPHAQEFRPGAWNIAAQPEHIQDLYTQWSQRAFSWAGEAAVSNIVTWFVDHRHFIHCFAGRIVTLHEDFESWEQRIRHTWQDMLDHNAQLEIHTVTPVPPRLEPYVAAHVVLVQAPREDWVTSLVSIFDRGMYGPEPRRAAVTTHEHIRIENLLTTCNYDPVCLNPQNAVHCQAWYDQLPLPPGYLLPGRSGYGIVVHVQRRPAPVYVPPIAPEQEGHVLLQTKATPKHKAIVCLDECVPAESHDLVPITLIDGSRDDGFPSQLFLPDPVRADAIEHELAVMGWIRHAYMLKGTGFAFCVDCAWSPPLEQFCYVYFSPGNCDRDSIILHLEHAHADANRHMRVLHSLGFCRAVIVASNVVRRGLALIEYHNNEPALEDQEAKIRTQTPWPTPMPIIQPKPFFVSHDFDADSPAHCLDLGIDLAALREFFHTGDEVLCKWHGHLELPDIVRNELQRRGMHEDCSHPLENFDRLVIYTDGSSKAQNRRKPPLWVQDCDVPGSRCMGFLSPRRNLYE